MDKLTRLEKELAQKQAQYNRDLEAWTILSFIPRPTNQEQSKRNALNKNLRKLEKEIRALKVEIIKLKAGLANKSK